MPATASGMEVLDKGGPGPLKERRHRPLVLIDIPNKSRPPALPSIHSPPPHSSLTPPMSMAQPARASRRRHLGRPRSTPCERFAASMTERAARAGATMRVSTAGRDRRVCGGRRRGPLGGTPRARRHHAALGRFNQSERGGSKSPCWGQTGRFETPRNDHTEPAYCGDPPHPQAANPPERETRGDRWGWPTADATAAGSHWESPLTNVCAAARQPILCRGGAPARGRRVRADQDRAPPHGWRRGSWAPPAPAVRH